MIDDIRKDAETRMKKSLESLRQDLSKLRTGRAHTSLLDHVTVSYYGSEVPLNQVSSITVGDARTLTIQPWEKDMVATVEKAIMTSDLGLTPNTAGTIIRINLPPLTEDRRRDMVRLVRQEVENARVAIRNIRRDAIGDIKELEKDKDMGLSEDDARHAQEEIQKLTDQYVAQADEMMTAKEKELMEV